MKKINWLKFLRITGGIGGWVFIFSSLAIADPPKIFEGQTPPSSLGLIIRLVLSMLLILGLIYASLYLLKRTSLRVKNRNGNEKIQVLERSFIAPKKSIYLVRIESKVLVLGVTDSQINLLAELPDYPSADSAPPSLVGSPQKKKFQAFLQEMRLKFGTSLKMKLEGEKKGLVKVNNS